MTHHQIDWITEITLVCTLLHTDTIYSIFHCNLGREYGFRDFLLGFFLLNFHQNIQIFSISGIVQPCVLKGFSVLFVFLLLYSVVVFGLHNHELI